MQAADKKKPQDQTVDEWLVDYDKFSGITYSGITQIKVPSEPSKNTDLNTYLFRYVGHRTTKKSCVALEFEILDSDMRAVKFFNVNLSGRKGKAYPAGKNGQFNPPERGKFRKFYKEITGEEPARWCRVHKSLRSNFRDLIFIGMIEHCIDSNGNGYYKITEITVHR